MRCTLLVSVLLLTLPFSAAEIVGDLNVLQDGADYDSLWKIQGSSTNLLLNDYSDWFTVAVQMVTSSGCVLGVAPNANVAFNSLTYETIPLGSIALLNGAYVGVVNIDLSPLRCDVAFNFVEVPSSTVASSGPLQGPTTSCSDSDDGIATQQQGTVNAVLSSGGSVVQTDVCVNSTRVREFRCFGPTYFGYYEYTCPGGCSQGACVADFCQETDGGFATYAAGTMTHEFGHIHNPVTDSCVGGSFLREYYCNDALFLDTNPENNNLYLASCPYGCMTSSFGGRCRYVSEAVSPWGNLRFGLQRVTSLLNWLF